MSLLTNGFEGGTAATAITAGNSGGASGDAFNSVSGATYSITHPRETLGAQLAAAGATLQWNLAGSVLALRTYLWITGYPSADFDLIVGKRTFDSSVRLRTSGLLQVFALDDSGNVSSTTGGIAVPLNQWVRVEARFTRGGANSVTTAFRLYSNPDAGATSDAQAITTTGATAASWSGIALKWASSSNAWADDLAASDVDWIGPKSLAVRPPPLSTAAVHRASRI
ncbi:hypothetical protein ACGFIV_01000 [Sphaerisporangium sp. NPDC049003]|uniref:hypothetical protein n=1 Tax=Sphaerisporangium sp. NPDC049003 TaxID=3364517 RepID=UPI003722A80B